MINRAELKEKAKESLRGKYGDAIGIILLLGLISFAIGLVTGIISGIFSFEESTLSIITDIVSLVVSSLFTFGYLNFFLKISRDEETSVSDLWSKTNMLVPCLIVTILIGLFTTLWTLLLIIPGIIAAFSYSMTYFVMLDNPEMSAMDAIKESKRIMNGHKMDFFVLELSFLGWIFLGVFTLGILYFWLMPYMYVTTCNFYNEIKELA